MTKSLQFLAVLAVSAALVLSGKQTINAQDRVWPPVDQQVIGVPRLGFVSYFDGRGERVVRVTPGSLAWEAGLEPRDVVVALNGTRLRYDGHWYDLMADAAYRGHITLSIRDWRTGSVVRRHIDLGIGDGDYDDYPMPTPKANPKPRR